MKKTGTTATFAYNADGLRVRKTVGSTVTDYTLHGKQVVHLKKGGDNLHFFYDAQGRPAIVEFNNVKYGYVHNVQGDIVAIIDESGNQLVEYTYDAWGKPLKKEGTLKATLGTLNPFRYRGYVYDEETGLYYLRSRYYNPVWGRFLNADTIIGNGELLSNNLFAYCANCVITYTDHSGKAPNHEAGAATGWGQAGDFGRYGSVEGIGSGSANGLGKTITTATLLLLLDQLTKSRTQEITRSQDSPTFMYRYGELSYQKYTAERGKDEKGFSFKLSPPRNPLTPFSVTTLEAVKDTGMFIAEQDGPDHVSVVPINPGGLEEWMDSFDDANNNPSIYTITLYNTVFWYFP